MSFHRSITSILPFPTSHGIGEKRVLISKDEVRSGITQIAVTELRKGERAEEHTHPDMEEFFIIRKGKVSISVGDETVACTADDFIFVPAGTRHSLYAEEDAELLTIGCAIVTENINE